MSFDLILIAIFLSAASGVAGLFLSRKTAWGQRIAVCMMCGSSLLGLAGALLTLTAKQTQTFIFPWPAMGNSLIGIDYLSAFFLVPVFFMGGLGSVYGLGYWPQLRHIRNARKLQLFWGTLVAGMSLLVISRHAVAFLFGWEVMALSAFFLVTTEHNLSETRQAGWIYIISTHIGTLTLFALFALWRWATGSYDLTPIAGNSVRLLVLNILFILSLLAFGLKAGAWPFHFWLPSAHACSPSHVSAMLSGIVLKMGIYGLVRFMSLLPDPPYIWGSLILLLGMISGLLGVVFAIGQHDLKRLLAYHSVENIGIILMGLGLAMLGRTAHQPTWIVLGLACCLLHTWNHSIFKSLLFLSAGSVVHSVRTRHIDSLGGLAKTMPWTAAMFAIGAVAICGLPPLNGFISELFVYIGLFSAVITKGSLTTVLAVPVLAMIGGLALACFVKVFSAVFLGSARSDACDHAHEAPITMRVPMWILATACFLIGLAPLLVVPILDNIISSWTVEANSPMISISSVVPLKQISFVSATLIVLIIFLMSLVRRRYQVSERVVTWDCGYARSSSRIQYTASSFAQMIVKIFKWVLRPGMHNPDINALFPKRAKMHSHVDDMILERLIMPVSRDLVKWFGWFRRFQQGITQQYLLYILITVIVMMSSMIPFKEFITRLFAR